MKRLSYLVFALGGLFAGAAIMLAFLGITIPHLLASFVIFLAIAGGILLRRKSDGVPGDSEPPSHESDND